jgi:DnaK suppressor protein
MMRDPEPFQMRQLQALLEQRKMALLRQLTDAGDAAGLRDIETAPADNASVRTLNDLHHGAVAHHAAQLCIVKHALGKFADGSYGSCEYCGEAIGLSRLHAHPEARFCINCQTRMEKVRR